MCRNMRSVLKAGDPRRQTNQLMLSFLGHPVGIIRVLVSFLDVTHSQVCLETDHLDLQHVFVMSNHLL